jgi:transcriptional regulator with GAF, ATPase, and Fis domain
VDVITKIATALGEEAEPLDAMKATFDDVAAVFGAERAVLLNPRAASPLNIVCNRGLKPEHLGAISRGVSTPGVSASTIQHVLQSKAPYIVEHPLLAAGSRRTASLAENYSVICAPVLDATGGLVLACYYFQNSGPNLKKAYRLHDMQLLNSICTLLTLLATQREIQDLSMRPDLTLREIRDEYTRRVVVNRLRRYPDNFGQVVESLGIQRAHLYRLLEKFDLPGAREAREARRSGEEIAAASAAVAVPDDDEDQ